MMDPATTEKVRDLMSLGLRRHRLPRDRRLPEGLPRPLRARGVEFTEALEDRPYGIDAGFRDPSGNNVRLTQVKEGL